MKVSKKKVIDEAILREMIKSAAWVLKRRTLKEPREEVGTINLGGATVQPKLLKFGAYNKETDEWEARDKDGVRLLNLCAGSPTDCDDLDVENIYFLINTPQEEHFVRLSKERFEIVKSIPVSFIRKMVDGEIGMLLDWFCADLKIISSFKKEAILRSKD